MMTVEKKACLSAFLLLFCVALVSNAAEENTRFFVKSNSAFFKKSLGVRHSFEDGFTTDATEWQLRLAKIFKVEIEPVKKLYVLPAGQEVIEPSGRARVVAPRPKPLDQTPWGIEAIYGDPLIVKAFGGAGVNVAVLDTGILKTHTDLKERVKECKDFTGKSPFLDNKCEDKNGHGTHVAGIIVADGGSDGLGVYGVSPESNLFVYKVCANDGSCWADDIASAIRLAADNGANVINLSLGSDIESSLIKNANSYAVNRGVLVVAAAGNDGPYQGSIDYPASNVDVIGVGAVDVSLVIADWSSRGKNSLTEEYNKEEGDIEFAAPGANIESTWKDGGYVILSGTSMAAPHVSGLAAKLWQKDADFPSNATRDLLRSFSRDIMTFGDDDDSGWGLPQL